MGIVSVYYYKLGVWPDFWYWTVVHNLTGYSSLEGRIPGLGELSRLLLLIVPASFGLQGISGLFILSSLVYLIPRFGLIHAQVGLALFIFLLNKRPKLYWPIFGLALLLLARIFAKEIPGKVLFYDQAAMLTVSYIERNADKTRPIYVYGVNDNIYHLTNTLPPNKFWIELLRGNIIEGVEDQLIEALKIDPPQFILIDPYASIDENKISEFTPLIWQYIRSHFILKTKLANDVEVWYPI